MGESLLISEFTQPLVLLPNSKAPGALNLLVLQTFCLLVASEIMVFTALNPRPGLYFEFLSYFCLFIVGPRELLHVINVYIAPFQPHINTGLWFLLSVKVSSLFFFHFLLFSNTFFLYISPQNLPCMFIF